MKTTTASGRLVLIIGLLCNLSHAQAQQIALPDSNWGNWLNANGFSSCLSGNATAGWQLDASGSAVQQAGNISCNGSGIRDISGISSFISLRILNCSQNELYSLPVLPASLTGLDCSANHLIYLPALPTGLTSLNCGNNQFSSLPSLPATLDHLECRDNQLTNLPALPGTLQVLSCINNRLSSLPALPSALVSVYCAFNSLSNLPNLPLALGTLYCNNNRLTSLPTLPASLSTLNCSGNSLTSLPTLPSGLGTLYCSQNQLISLPSLPANLIYFIVDMNQLSSMPALPPQLSTLSCNYNFLSSIPSLPAHLQTLYCSNNQLSNLPLLPPALTKIDCSNNALLKCLPQIYTNSLNEFYIAGTQIGCLPNRFTASNYDIDPAGLAVCNAASGCSSYNSIADQDAEIGAMLLYPNPNSGFFTLETAKASTTEYCIYDMMGALIMQHSIADEREIITMPYPAAGIYTVVVKNETGSKAIRFVVNK